MHFAKSCEIWGADIEAEYIYWCRQHLSPPFHFATTTTIPHLPFEDRHFALIYCMSVFTHIDDLAEAWLLELRRVLSPEGRLLITICDRHTVELLDGPRKDHPFAKRMRGDATYRRWKDRSQMLVVGRDASTNVFYDIDYFRRTLDPMYRVLSVVQEGLGGYQTALLLARK